MLFEISHFELRATNVASYASHQPPINQFCTKRHRQDNTNLLSLCAVPRASHRAAQRLAQRDCSCESIAEIINKTNQSWDNEHIRTFLIDQYDSRISFAHKVQTEETQIDTTANRRGIHRRSRDRGRLLHHPCS